MNYDRNQALKNFINSPEFSELCKVTQDESVQIDYSNRSNNIVIEALKTLLMSHSQSESTTVILRKVNAKIQSLQG